MFTLFCPHAGKSEADLPLQSGFVILLFYCYALIYTANKADCL